MTRPQDVPKWAWEKAWRIAERFYAYRKITSNDEKRLRRVIARALMEAAAAKVKPLEWTIRSGAFGDEWKSETVVGRYDVGMVHSGFTAVRRSVDSNDASDTALVRGVGVEQAKAAAQADYERRILSALITPPETASVVSHNSENLEDKSGWLSPGEAKENGNV